MPAQRPMQLLDWRPDADPNTAGVLTNTDGVFGSTKGLKTLASWVPGAALPARCLGAHSAVLTGGQRVVIAGTAANLYRLRGGVWEEWAKGVTFRTDPVRGRWRFAVFGNHVLATNGTDPVQVSLTGQRFIPLAELSDVAPPLASLVEVVDEGVFLVPPGSNQWYFSPVDTLWTPSIATGVVTAALRGTPGPIVGLKRIRNGIVMYKEGSLWFGQFTGPPFFWSFTSVSEVVGATSHEVVANAHDLHLFLGPDDFYTFDGNGLSRLENAVKEHFLGRMDARRLARTVARYDPTQSLAVWHYTEREGDTAPLDEMLIHNLRTGKWTHSFVRDTEGLPLGVEAVVQPVHATATGITYQQFQETYGSYGNIPAITYGDPLFGVSQETLVPAIITDAHALATADGPSVGGFVTTGELGDGINFYQLNRVRPIFAKWPVDNVARLVSVVRRVNGYPTPDPNPFPQPWAGPVAYLQRDGFFNLIATARSHMLRVDVFADAELTALVLDGVPAGRE